MSQAEEKEAMAQKTGKSGVSRAGEAVTVSFVFFCERHFVAEGKDCYLFVFDRVQASKFPLEIPSLHLAAEFQGPVGQKFKVKLLFQDGEEKDVLPGLSLSGIFSEYGTARFQVDIRELKLKAPGEYVFRFLKGREEIGRRSLWVEKVEGGL